MAKIRQNMICISREPMLSKDCDGGASYERRVGQNFL
jgi:hypothetical protein